MQEKILLEKLLYAYKKKIIFKKSHRSFQTAAAQSQVMSEQAAFSYLLFQKSSRMRVTQTPQLYGEAPCQTAKPNSPLVVCIAQDRQIDTIYSILQKLKSSTFIVNYNQTMTNN